MCMHVFHSQCYSKLTDHIATLKKRNKGKIVASLIKEGWMKTLTWIKSQSVAS